MTKAEAQPTVKGSGFVRNRTEGYVISCDGERAVIAAEGGKETNGSDDYWAVGQMISVRVGKERLVGLIYQVEAPKKNWEAEERNVIHVYIELVGQVSIKTDGKLSFSTGIANYPHMGAIAHRIRTADLKAIYDATAPNAVSIGTLTQDKTIPAMMDVDKLLARHFAVVGTTGVGKSTAVTLLLRKIVEQRPDVRVLLLDPHNEFTTAFADHAITVDANRLDLPFWMFRLEEFSEVIFRGRTPAPIELDTLRDLIPVAKMRYRKAEMGQRTSSLFKRERDATTLTADTPIPYRMVDLLALIDERAGQLEGKTDRPHLRALRNRLDALLNDPRFRFMFGSKTISDTMPAIISHIFRVPQNGKPICVLDMSNLPADVVNAVVSVFCRMAFELAVNSDGGLQTLVICEEAHRYIPSDTDFGFWPTRQAISRIAKEGRKYGVYLGVVTQRPGELDATILSQCSSIFSMRLGNERDQEIIKLAITGAARSLTNFLSSIANRECIAFGEAFQSPMRMLFETVARKDLPGAHIYEHQARLKSGQAEVDLLAILNKMRSENSEENEFAVETLPQFTGIDPETLADAVCASPEDMEMITAQSGTMDYIKEKAPERSLISGEVPLAPSHDSLADKQDSAVQDPPQIDPDTGREIPKPGTGPQFWTVEESKPKPDPDADIKSDNAVNERKTNDLIRGFRARR